jgi:hypothetical protein
MTAFVRLRSDIFESLAPPGVSSHGRKTSHFPDSMLPGGNQPPDRSELPIYTHLQSIRDRSDHEVRDDTGGMARDSADSSLPPLQSWWL